MSLPRYAQLSLEDLAMPISSNALRILALLRIRCWSREGTKARELTYSDIAEATRLGRQAVGTAVRELIDVGLVQATPRPGGVWRYLVCSAPVADRPGPVGRARRAGLGPKRSRPNPLSSPPESAEQPCADPLSSPPESAEQTTPIRSADHADPLSGSVTDDVTTHNRLVTTVDDPGVDGLSRLDPTRAAYVASIEARSRPATPAKPSYPGGLDPYALQIRIHDAMAGHLADRGAKLSHHGARLGWPKDDPETAKRNLCAAVAEHGLDRVIAACGVRWDELVDAERRGAPQSDMETLRRVLQGLFSREAAGFRRGLDQLEVREAAIREQTAPQPAPDPEPDPEPDPAPLDPSSHFAQLFARNGLIAPQGRPHAPTPKQPQR